MESLHLDSWVKVATGYLGQRSHQPGPWGLMADEPG